MNGFKCRECDTYKVHKTGYCKACLLCKENNIVDFEEFGKFYHNTHIEDDMQKVKYYKELVELNGGIE